MAISHRPDKEFGLPDIQDCIGDENLEYMCFSAHADKVFGHTDDAQLDQGEK